MEETIENIQDGEPEAAAILTAETDSAAQAEIPGALAYTPVQWSNGEGNGTPVNAANLNNMEEAIVALVQRTAEQIVTDMIKDGAITLSKLDSGVRDSLSRKLTVGNNLGNTIIDALPENDRPFQITGTSAMGRYTIIFSIAGISLYDHDANKHHGPIRWE